jgi:hypothetical protein
MSCVSGIIAMKDYSVRIIVNFIRLVWRVNEPEGAFAAPPVRPFLSHNPGTHT